MEIVQCHDGWWICNVPGFEGNCGPYKTRKEAKDDMRGMRKFFRENPDLMTVENMLDSAIDWLHARES